MKLGAVQPAYLAWAPFFKRMQMSDIFIYLDDVEYSKNSFHNRNRIKTANGPLLLTVPVSYKGNSRELICNIKINNSTKWRSKHWKAIEVNYSRAPFFTELAPRLLPIYEQPWDKLGELNVALLETFREFLEIKSPVYTSSQLGIYEQGNDKLIEMCRRFGADQFIVKPNTESYHPSAVFNAAGIDFAYFDYKLEPYPQLYGDFVPGLSILDYAMNCGPASLKE